MERSAALNPQCPLCRRVAQTLTCADCVASGDFARSGRGVERYLAGEAAAACQVRMATYLHGDWLVVDNIIGSQFVHLCACVLMCLRAYVFAFFVRVCVCVYLRMRASRVCVCVCVSV